ncbi:MAG: GNAT family N-acetyltransferase [Proteobacteria bacterium]|nr:GNAT family N-acetyltransferase [Pseudomonadota bacterium]
MRTIVRDVCEQDLPSVLALNNAAGAGILPIDSERLRYFWEHAVYFRVAERDGAIAGFLIALSTDAAYSSPNFLWFREHYPDFVYIDRIVIAGAHRGEGLGHVFYADVQSFAEVRSQRLACEVFVTGGNDAALLFHGGFGFKQVGQQVQSGSGLRAVYLIKDLCSFPWVRDTYLHAGMPGLPEVDWLRARHTCATHATSAPAQH